MSSLEGRYSPGTRERRGRAWVITTIAFAVIGIGFRLDQLGAQMLLDDEWHAVRRLIEADAGGIAAHFGLADYCIPLTLYYRWLYQYALLDEWQMHLPLLLAGIGLLLAVPFLLRDVLTARTHAIWTGLIGLSPSLVYFSRTARPYALLALLGVAAFLAFRRWQRERRMAWAALYAFATIAAAWLQPLSLVFLLWPFAHYGTAAVHAALHRDAHAREALLRLLVLALVVAAGVALVLAVPIANDWAMFSEEAAAERVTLHVLWRALLIGFGVGNLWVGLAMLVFFLVGVRDLWKRDPDFALLVLGGIGVGTAIVCVARPSWIALPPALVRHSAPMLPFLLLFVAAGFAAVLARLRVMLAITLISAALLGLLLVGPLPLWLKRPNQFVGHAAYQFDYDEAENPFVSSMKLGPVPAFFTELAQRPAGSVTLIETPASARSNFTPDPWYQRIHRQNVKYALAAPVCAVAGWDEYSAVATGDRFANVLRLTKVLDGHAGGADYLVVRLRPWLLPPDVRADWPDMQACVGRISERIGKPVFADDQIAVFALAAKPG